MSQHRQVCEVQIAQALFLKPYYLEITWRKHDLTQSDMQQRGGAGALGAGEICVSINGAVILRHFSLFCVLFLTAASVMSLMR